MLQRRERTDWDKLIEHFLDHGKFAGSKASEDQRFLEDSSEQVAVARVLLEVAVENAKAEAIDPASPAAMELLGRAWDIGKAVIYAYDRLPGEPTDARHARRYFQMTSTAQPGSILRSIEKDGPIPVNMPSLERAVLQYLRSEFRHEGVDRLLVRALAEGEITHYLHQMVRKDYLTNKSKHDEAKDDLGLQWWVSRGKALLVTIVFVIGLLATEFRWPQTPDWLGIIGIPLVVCGFLLWTIVSAVLLILFGEKIRAPHRKTLQLMELGAEFMNEFRADSTIAISQLRRAMENGRSKGMIWPGALWGLLEDLEARGVRVI